MRSPSQQVVLEVIPSRTGTEPLRASGLVRARKPVWQIQSRLRGPQKPVHGRRVRVGASAGFRLFHASHVLHQVVFHQVRATLCGDIVDLFVVSANPCTYKLGVKKIVNAMLDS